MVLFLVNFTLMMLLSKEFKNHEKSEQLYKFY